MIIGLTGGIGSGKSTASALLQQLGYSIVDADIVAREVVELGSPALNAIKAHFGKTIVTSKGLNRAALRELIFNQPTEKKWLEELLHPMIRREIFDQLTSAIGPIKILEAPLLYENNLVQLCRYTIAVDVPIELQIERALQRDNSKRETIENIIASQIPRKERLERADFILDNTGDLENLETQVAQLHTQLMTLHNSL